MSLESLGHRLFLLRMDSDETKTRVADLIGKRYSYITRLEKGRAIKYPPANELYVLAVHFRVTVEYLMTGEGLGRVLTTPLQRFLAGHTEV